MPLDEVLILLSRSVCWLNCSPHGQRFFMVFPDLMPLFLRPVLVFFPHDTQ